MGRSPGLSALEIMRLIRHALREAGDLAAAMQLLADRLDRLTAELAEGELLELIRLATRALRVLEPGHNGGGAA